MEYQDSAKLVYRKLVSSIIRDLVTFPYEMSLTQVASRLHLTIGQMSRVYHGTCSLSPERFLALIALYGTMTGRYPSIIYSIKNISDLPQYGID